MELRSITRDQTAEIAAGVLGVERHDLFNPEGLAAALRRAASFLCPASRRELVDRTMESLGVLPGAPADLRAIIKESIDDLASVGDLVESTGTDVDGYRLFLRMPAFVRLGPDTVLLIGVRPDAAELTTSGVARCVRARGPLRMLSLPPGDSQVLSAEGLVEVSRDSWLGMPRAVAAEAVFERYMSRLLVASPLDSMPECEVIDGARAHYYKGRFRKPTTADDGLFVGRRFLKYGASQWCVLLLTPGEQPRVLDLPLLYPDVPAVDEARRLLAACDAVDGHPQRVRLGQAPVGSRRILLDAPVPSWCERYLLALGTATKSRGALVSYEASDASTQSLIDFLRINLWMTLEEHPS